MSGPSQIPDWLSTVGDGWHPLLLSLHRDLLLVAPDYKVGQISEKFAGLRVYLDSPYTKEINELISRTQDASLLICEICGRRGERGFRPGSRIWLKTLCEEHRKG